MPLESDLREGAPWQFDAAVAERFDEMLERSIPELETMRDVVTLAASSRLHVAPLVLDLGCARGEALARIAELPGTEGHAFVGLEVSPPMLAAARERFAGDARVDVVERDLREGLRGVAADDACVVLSVLTLMFVPTNYRLRLVGDVYDQLAPGGALVLVEKVLGDGPILDDVETANYHLRKRETGYAPDEIARKRLALEGVLVPQSAEVNRLMLRRAGFREVDEIWAWFNFRAWAAVK